MRWIDIALNTNEMAGEPAALLCAAAEIQNALPDLQGAEGLDSPRLVDRMAEAGQLLFRAATWHRPDAFDPTGESASCIAPATRLVEMDPLTGFHLVLPPELLALPWTWLHNGVGFLLERYPICAALRPSALPDRTEFLPWMRRFSEARLLEQVEGENTPAWIAARNRPRGCAEPEILFVPGHCQEEIRRLIYREADGIRRALGAGAPGRPLALLRMLSETVTPTLLARRGTSFQGLHFAGPTSQPLTGDDPRPAAWLAEMGGVADLEEAGLYGTGTAIAELDAADPIEQLGLAGDQINELLRIVSARAEANRPTLVGATVGGDGSHWLLEDGPVVPEQIERGGGLPAFVFSNSYLSYPQLGARFLSAGASVFVGPHVPLFSRPARKFAGRFYNFLSDGHCAATAFREAALACRAQFGREHPVWLSYGLAGYGSLALQYL